MNSNIGMYERVDICFTTLTALQSLDLVHNPQFWICVYLQVARHYDPETLGAPQH